ncbi:MAG TPA: leucyl aminopeptidase family protein [Rhodopila sp.]|nr:leucyl aminopeptidase family protein [Rhodopila sp.]
MRPDGLDALLDRLPAMQGAYLRDSRFAAKSGEFVLLPGAEGVAAAVLGLGADSSPFAFGRLHAQLPATGPWRLEPGDYDPAMAYLGFCLGAYHFGRFRARERHGATLVVPQAHAASVRQAQAVWMVRDLVNTPPNLLGPVELADFAVSLAQRFGAGCTLAAGAELERQYPTVAAVGAGSARPPRVVTFHWRGSRAGESAPFVSLCGKGVCFDTGGYDLKPSAGMLRMKKDMGGAATVLGVARAVMEADLPIRLAVRVGCVENSVSGSAMRPSDVLRTRSGLTVEVGNTDAEGRLVLCDLLHEACEEAPNLVIDCATLTGAARVALGPDLPALFSNDDVMADSLQRLGLVVHDPVWRLPLWSGYDDWLKSSVADLNNVSSKPMAGAVTAALYLQRFIKPGIPWMHLDLYAWNDTSRSGRPEGGEAMAMRAILALLKEISTSA